VGCAIIAKVPLSPILFYILHHLQLSWQMLPFSVFVAALLLSVLALASPLRPDAQLKIRQSQPSTPKIVIAHFMVGNTYPYTIENWSNGALPFFCQPLNIEVWAIQTYRLLRQKALTPLL
jgi:hypothetical protein